ncbi:MAG: nicotinate-nucleotide adenylyltransferase [Sphaerospermopsis sp. SIO1G2]|nr:nicotinate-nucleotide adenylyltransferase [Sphaerospermopsis sp. SIO1G1]NET70323.1 nicotinate-nucleotide adenylyltransferase [Sphaerospermopsis sp. SIO1G2]
MKNIALFGTSADPPTAGHKKIIKCLSQSFDWVAVWAVDNPFKNQKTSLKHRAAMLELLISDIESTDNNISLEQEISNLRTLETVEKAKTVWGANIAYTLVIGSDLIGQLTKWYHIENLLNQVKLLIIPRPGYPIDDLSLNTVRNLGGKIAIANFMGLDVSSTTFREQKNMATLTPPVIDYIHREHLYV